LSQTGLWPNSRSIGWRRDDVQSNEWGRLTLFLTAGSTLKNVPIERVMMEIAMTPFDTNSLPSAREFLKLSRRHSLVPVYSDGNG